jgi:hypothetical protein
VGVRRVGNVDQSYASGGGVGVSRPTPNGSSVGDGIGDGDAVGAGVVLGDGLGVAGALGDGVTLGAGAWPQPDSTSAASTMTAGSRRTGFS